MISYIVHLLNGYNSGSIERRNRQSPAPSHVAAPLLSGCRTAKIMGPRRKAATPSAGRNGSGCVGDGRVVTRTRTNISKLRCRRCLARLDCRTVDRRPRALLHSAITADFRGDGDLPRGPQRLLLRNQPRAARRHAANGRLACASWLAVAPIMGHEAQRTPDSHHPRWQPAASP